MCACLCDMGMRACMRACVHVHNYRFAFEIVYLKMIVSRNIARHCAKMSYTTEQLSTRHFVSNHSGRQSK